MSNFQASLNALISHINVSMYDILMILRTYFPYVLSVMNYSVLGWMLTYL